MNITIKITHASGTVMEVSIPVMDSAPVQVAPAVVTPDEVHVASEPAIMTDCMGDAVTAEDLKPSGVRYTSVQEMVEAKKDLYGEEAVQLLKETIFKEDPAEQTGSQFPCQDGIYALPPNLYSDFCSAFGQTMVDRELTLACLWLKSNPTKLKTRRGMSRYLNAWLCRAQGEKRQPIKGRSGSLLDCTNTSQKGW